MKTKYLYVPNGDGITANSVVIWLFVGTSRRDRTKLKLLECYANDIGGFLRIADGDTDYWLDSHAAKLFHGSKVPRLHLTSASMSINECYQHTIDGDLDLYVKNKPKPTNFLSTLIRLDPEYMRSVSKNHVLPSAQAGKSKYLSHSLGSCVFYSLMPIWLILGCAIIDRLGEICLNYLFG